MSTSVGCVHLSSTVRPVRSIFTVEMVASYGSLICISPPNVERCQLQPATTSQVGRPAGYENQALFSTK